MAFDIQLRTPQGIRKVSELQAIRHINKLVYPITLTSSVNTFIRNHTQSLKDYVDFSGKNFTIFGTGGRVSGARVDMVGVEIYWNGGRIINANSTFGVKVSGVGNPGAARIVIDLYIVETY